MLEGLFRAAFSVPRTRASVCSVSSGHGFACRRHRKTLVAVPIATLVYFWLRAVDANGLQVPDATTEVKVSVKGPGHLVALDDGDIDVACGLSDQAE